MDYSELGGDGGASAAVHLEPGGTLVSGATEQCKCGRARVRLPSRIRIGNDERAAELIGGTLADCVPLRSVSGRTLVADQHAARDERRKIFVGVRAARNDGREMSRTYLERSGSKGRVCHTSATTERGVIGPFTLGHRKGRVVPSCAFTHGSSVHAAYKVG